MKNPIKIATEFLSARKLIEKSYGVVIGGSHIRGEALPGSDIDLFLVYKKNFNIEFTDAHSQLIVYKGIPISLITESKSNVESLLRDKDPSVISFFRECVILHDSKNMMSKYIAQAKSTSIFINKKGKQQSMRRLRERIVENIRRIENALLAGDEVLASYLLRKIIDEVIEKRRMYYGDWLYSQYKLHLKFLNQLEPNDVIKIIFYQTNPSLKREKLRNIIANLKLALKKSTFPN